MYAKLVVGTSNIMAVSAIRDIGRLITATEGNVSTNLLGAFSVGSSVILDATPAGWTYVGSTEPLDQPTIGPTNTVYTQTANLTHNLCFSAPCLEGTALKYCVLSVQYNQVTYTTTPANYYGCMCTLAGATSATSLGIVTNEGPRIGWQTTTNNSQAGFRVTAGDIIHVIANPRHITIIAEGFGVIAVWESNTTDVNRFYNSAPFIQYTHAQSTSVAFLNFTGPRLISAGSTQAYATAFNVTAVSGANAGTTYGGYDISTSGTLNTYFLAQTDITSRQNSIDSLGNPKYQITPVLYSLNQIGHPVQYVSGVVPVYWTKGSLGNTGDTVLVGTETYTYFNCGTGFGLIMQTD